jgi:NDP-sugar pyrophosphorylase family protein
MRAVILAGGLGTRLRPYTTVIPKPLVPVADRPVLEHIIRQLEQCGVDRFDVCLGYLGRLIRLYLSQADLPENVRIAYHWEEEPLGTAGALRMVPDLDGPVIVMNGDILTTLDYCALVEHHLEAEAALTIAMQVKRVQVDLGVIQSEQGFVSGFVEKPRLDYNVSMGVYVYDTRALSYLPEGPCQFPDLVVRLLAAGERVAAYHSGAEWFDIGTPAEYERAALAVQQAPELYGVARPVVGGLSLIDGGAPLEVVGDREAG